MTNVFFLGGSFDPPHLAHVFAACYLSQLDEVDLILIAPICKHSFGKPITASFMHRFAMCNLAFGWVPKTRVSEVEEDLANEFLEREESGEEVANYTVDTIAHLKKRHPDWVVRFVVGADTARDLAAGKWERSENLLAMAEPYILGRADVEDGRPVILPRISSTEIRASLKRQLDEKIAKAFLSPAVYRYIKEHKLYTEESSDQCPN